MPSWKKVIVSGSDATLNSLYVTNSVTASYFTGSVRATYLTASGLNYPTADGGEFSFIQTDGSGNLSLQYVNTTNDNVYNGEATTLLRGTPVFVSGSVGANPKVFRADASNPAKMPVTYIVGDDILTAETGRAIILGQIDGVDTTGYPEGQLIYVAEGGGWTNDRPTGSSSIVQPLGIVTKEGSGGKGLVLNPGPVLLPNLQSGYTWVGSTTNQPVAVATSSIQNVVSASYALTASYIAGGGGSGTGFPYSGSASITGSLDILAPNGYATDYADNYSELGAAANFQGSLTITGSLELANNYTMSADYVNVGEVLKLNASNPLPTAGVGLLAVSASNLYYSNGITWTQIN